MKRLADKIAFITGAASGIGLACAKRFAAEGATVYGTDINTPNSTDWDAVTGASPDSMFVVLDVTDESAVKARCAEAISTYRRVDILVNSAGVMGIGAATQVDTDYFDQVMDINLKGSFLTCKYLVEQMVEQRNGAIVNLSSIYGYMAGDGNLPYNVSKGAVLQLTRSLSADYAWANVRCNALCPGLIETPLTDVVREIDELNQRFISWHMANRAGTPEEVAAAALFLASDDASFINGVALPVDGGLSSGRRMMPAPTE